MMRAMSGQIHRSSSVPRRFPATLHGWHEQNPLLRHPDGRVRWGRAVALKGVQVVGLTLLDREIAKRSKRTAWALRVVAVAVHVAVAAHNTKAAR